MASLKRTLVLTGANGGIATGFLAQFFKSPYTSTIKGLYTVRNDSKAETLRTNISHQAPPGHDYEITTLDFSSLQHVRTVANNIKDRVAKGDLPPIRALVLNAGIQETRQQDFTIDGIEHTFAVNYLYNFLLVLLLLGSMDKEHGRIVVIGTTTIDPDWAPNKGFYTTKEQKTFFTSVDRLARGEATIEDELKAGMRRYAMSKVMMVMFMYELQRRLNASPTLSSISILALDPGWVSTSIGRQHSLSLRITMASFKYLAPVLLYFWPNHFVRTATKTGGDLVTACFDLEKFGEFPKALYINGAKIGEVTVECKDQEKWAELWEGSVKWAGVNEGDTVVAIN